MEKNFSNLDIFDDLRKNVGFHFTPKQNLESILETGLVPRFGSNSTGALGQSAIPKPYVSYSLEGVLQLYNRMINLPLEVPTEYIQSASHKAFLPESVKARNNGGVMTILEALEFTRQYMENNVYLMFDVTMSEYEHELSDETLLMINSEIPNIKDENGNSLVQRIKEINDEINRLIKDKSQDNSKRIEELSAERNGLSIEIWKKTIKTVKDNQGQLLNGNDNLLIDGIDYNDERCIWTNFKKHPHNTHTMIVDDDGKLQGKSILPSQIHVFSENGKDPANGLQFLKSMYSRVKDSDRLRVEMEKCVDPNLIGIFCEYLELIDQYRKDGLLVQRPVQEFVENNNTLTYESTLILDTSDISRYPGLEEFVVHAEDYYKEARKECKETRNRIVSERKEMESKLLASTFVKEKSVALLSEEADSVFHKLDKDNNKDINPQDLQQGEK